MNKTRLLLLAACLVPLVASAQWQWIDKDGRKVFSDRAPPDDIPASKILRQPGAPAPRPSANTETPPGSAATGGTADVAARPASGALPKISGTDKGLDEKRKTLAKAEADKKAADLKAEEARIAASKADNCTRAKASKGDFDSGVRIARTNAQGEREYLDDAQRASEVKRLQAVIERDCKTTQ